jgi:glyoxylase I family protein
MVIAAGLHVALLVSDLPRAERFYGTVLGLEQVERSLRFPGTWYQIGDFQIHLILAETWAAPLPNQQKWGRNPHLALGVTDLEIVRQRLQADHYPIQMSASGRAALFTQDPDGNIIELSQLSPVT